MFESACELVMLVSVKLRICQYVCESECGRAVFSLVHQSFKGRGTDISVPPTVQGVMTVIPLKQAVVKLGP